MPEREFQLAVIEREARFILEALTALEAKWVHIGQTTEDEDLEAEYSRDAAVLDITRERVERLALESFGPQITNFLHEPSLLESSEDPAETGRARRRGRTNGATVMYRYPAFRASLGEWRTVMQALQFYKLHLDQTVFPLGQEEAALVRYDHLERLQRIIPSFERQLAEIDEH